MNIQIIATSVETKPTAKGSYQILEVTYKNLTFQGKTETKKVMSFGANASAFKVLAEAQPGSAWEVDVVKNAQGYNDWTAVRPGNADAPAGAAASARGAASAPQRSTYETPEERAQRQVYIIRQSSLSAALGTLSVGAKAVKATDVMELAEQYTDFVLNGRSQAKQDIPLDANGFPDVPFDLPEVQ